MTTMADALEGLDVDFTVRLWKGNRVDGEFDIKASDLMTGFRSYAESCDSARRDYYGSWNMLVDYITSHDWLDSAIVWPIGVMGRMADEAPSLTAAQVDVIEEAARRLVWGR